MKTSAERILTTHVGSLPRPPQLLEFLEAREIGRPFEQAAFDACLTGAVREVVQKQVAAGIDSVCDGELGKISYTFYIRHRLSGISAFRGSEVESPPQTAAHRDRAARRCRAAPARSPTRTGRHWKPTFKISRRHALPSSRPRPS